MEETLAKQFRNSKNINARIELHQNYSTNPIGWFPWIYQKLELKEGMKVLEVGCGNGQLWKDNLSYLPPNIQVILSDISSGMLRNAKSKLKGKDTIFTYQIIDFTELPFMDETFDIVVANHVLFYAKDREKTLQEIRRVMRNSGLFCCSTYGRYHMKEIEDLAKEFDERIALSEVKLYDIFGLENGINELSSIFNTVETFRYEDSLVVTKMQPLIEYIYSCHGNQLEFSKDQEEEFEAFIRKKIGKQGMHITKDAGILCCRK